MKAFLMHRDRDFDLNAVRPPNAAELMQDLELGTLFRAMAGDDDFVLKVVETAVLANLHDPDAILYRQHVLADCMAHQDLIREMFAIAGEAIEREKRVWGWMSIRAPESSLHRSVSVLEIFVELLKRLRNMADEHAAGFRSEGFMRFFGMITSELDDEYLRIVEDHLERLKFDNGVLMSVELGEGGRGANYILRKQSDAKLSWNERFHVWLEQLAGRDGGGFVYEVADRDEAGFRALSELSAQGIAHVAAALAQSTDHIMSFFSLLRLELGFYVGCLNLRDRLSRKGEPICLPEPLSAHERALSARGLYDVCLSLSMEEKVVGNDIAGDGKMLAIVTGANRGGKSTFLRSIGLAQLMMQSGMFVPGEQFRANVCHGVFTHFKREEDAGMKSGKLDEELRRMSAIVDNIPPGSLVLFNESFASTNEREGSEIARQIVRSLLETGMKVFYVTHMFDLAQGFYRTGMNAALFLRAERLPDGRRTYRLMEGEPLPTSFGADLYMRIFQAGPDGLPARSPVQTQ